MNQPVNALFNSEMRGLAIRLFQLALLHVDHEEKSFPIVQAVGNRASCCGLGRWSVGGLQLFFDERCRETSLAQCWAYEFQLLAGSEVSG
jgi:hypothetical protein